MILRYTATFALCAALCAATAAAASAGEPAGPRANFRHDAPAVSTTGAFAGVTFRVPAVATLLTSASMPVDTSSPAPSLEFVPEPGVDRQTPPRQVPFEYSEAYRKRARVHKAASVAILPLFATQAVLGASLYDAPSSGKRTAHRIVATGIGGLFVVNTITGVWNLIEGRHDPNRRGLRLAHGLLMLSADAGFLATALTAPGTDGSGSRTTHRALAFTSIGVATTGYLIMLLGNR